jgi:hypothetical protein
MLRIFTLLLALTCAASAQVPMTGGGLAGPVAAGCSYNVATCAWAAAVVTAGGTVGTTEEGYVDTLIVALKTGYTTNYFTSCDHIWLHASENVYQAKIDIIANASVVYHGATESGQFAASHGYTGNASSVYLDSGFQSGTNYTVNSASIAIYVLNTRSTGAYIDIGNNNVASAGANISPSYSGTTYYAINDYGGETGGASSSLGSWLVTRTGVSATALYKNSSATAVSTSTTAVAAGVTALNMAILARNNNGTIGSFTSDTIAITAFCGGLTGTQSSQLQTIFNNYMTSLGTNVY